MNYIFFASVALFMVAYGKCRQIMLEANKNALTAKTRYHDTHTIYLDGRPYIDDAVVYSGSERLDNEPVYRGAASRGVGYSAADQSN